MSNVTLTIGGRAYTVACATGEEGHVEELGRLIDGKLGGLPGGAAQSESRSLLFAALLLADEVHELRCRAAEDGDGTGALHGIAARLENLARHLEGQAASA